MKKIVLFSLLIGLICSCSDDNGVNEDFHFEILPISTVQIPEILVANDVNRVIYTYLIPSTCHSFSDLYFLENGNESTVAVVNLVTSTAGAGLACESLLDLEEERGFDFFVAPGFTSYIFNFWQGEDENGEDIYLTIEVPVGAN